MILQKISVDSFRTFTSHQEVDVDPRITILMGANESGKTNLLHAINCCSLDVNFQYEDISKSKTLYFARKIMPKVCLTFILDDDDREKLVSIIPISIDWHVISVLKKGNGISGYSISIPPYNQYVKTEKVIKRIITDITEIDAEIEEINDYIEKSNKKISDIETQQIDAKEKDNLEALGLLDNELKNIINDIEDHYNNLEDLENKKKSLNEQISELRKSSYNAEELDVGLSNDQMLNLLNMLPKNKYIKELNFLPESITIQELIEQQTPQSIAVGNLLKIGGIESLNILNEGLWRVKPILQSTANLISERLSEAWKQERLDVNLSKEGDNLVISILERVAVSSSPRERSEGFQWFLSFFANFVLESKDNLENQLLLFDEPALQLHPKGQKNFLEALERISLNNQIIYTSHSPFLINKNFPFRIRILTKDSLKGTIVNNKPYSDGKSRFWEPLKSAIGVSLGDLFSLGEINLIVEGISDQIIITGISHKLGNIGITYLDLENITIVPAMGALCATYLGHFCVSEELSAVVLLDNDSEGKRMKKKLTEESPELKVFLVNQFKKRATNIEDLLPKNQYINAINSFYNKLRLPEYVEYKDAINGNKKPSFNIIKNIRDHFKEIKISFSKTSVAKELIANLNILDENVEEYEPFINMFNEINDMILKR